MTSGRAQYCGRFAPSPTGPLHAGSLFAAVASYLDARARGGRWLVRIEDLDVAREVPGAASEILATLSALALHWDGEIVYQSSRSDRYELALKQLIEQGLVYPCSCSRAAIARIVGPASPGSELRYPGTCRDGPLRQSGPHAWRLRVPSGEITYIDELQGVQSIDVLRTTGDFVLKRRDGPFAYQLAVVVDDAECGITHVVRGADLLDNTQRQILLHRALGLPTPHYAHVALLVDARGAKLAKSTQAPAIDRERPTETLWNTLHAMRQAPPLGLRNARPETLLEWATERWSLTSLSGLSRLSLRESRLGKIPGIG